MAEIVMTLIMVYFPIPPIGEGMICVTIHEVNEIGADLREQKDIFDNFTIDNQLIFLLMTCCGKLHDVIVQERLFFLFHVSLLTLFDT